MPRDKRVGVGICVFLYEPRFEGPARFLMGHRCGEILTNRWALPGGWLETGEQPIDTAVRELEEECGLILHPSRLQLIGSSAQPIDQLDVWCLTEYYAAQWGPADGEPKVTEPNKLDEWRWFTPDALPANIMASTYRAVERFYGNLRA